MYIEDLIKLVTNNFGHLISYRDMEIMQSICDQLYLNDSVTEKQGSLILRILNTHKDSLRSVIHDISEILEVANWQKPFRTLNNIRKISIEKRKSPNTGIEGTSIVVRFPFDKELVEHFRSLNSSVHQLHRGAFDQNDKVWVFSLTEHNILKIGDSVLSRDFQSSEEFLEYYNECNSIRSNIEKNIPLLVHRDGQYSIDNAHALIPQPNTDNLVEALFHARSYGITTWCDDIEDKINKEVNAVTKTVLLSTKKNRPWFNSDVVDIDEFENLLMHNKPILIIVPGGSELELTKKWVKFAQRLGIDNTEISVMFRLPNDQNAFNQYVKDHRLNTAPDHNTRIVFVSTKITKPLIKAGIKFNTIINLGYYQYMHFSMNAVVENSCNLVYYSITQPVVLNKWQQQELL